MQYVDYVEIENFKGFGPKIRVPLDSPSVLIGPNNSGKTTVLQALTLWGQAVFEWTDRQGRGDLTEDGSVTLNRLLMLTVPVKDVRMLWNGTLRRGGGGHAGRVTLPGDDQMFSIAAGIRLESGDVRPLCMEFRMGETDFIYARPSEECLKDAALLKAAGKIRFHLLYPMSGIAAGASDTTDEPLWAPGRINVLMGQGQTAQIIRNICYDVWEHSPSDWKRVCEVIGNAFKCAFDEPQFVDSRGAMELTYRQRGVAEPLELSMAGRGVQQMLLLLAYLFRHKGGVLLVDEPDAHLEILRQRQAFAILKDLAEETRTQVVIATHSEVILDEAIETNLVSLASGHVADLTLRRDVKTTLRSLGVQHYYNAEQKKRLLIAEGSTDVSMLRAFAVKLGHPAAVLLNDTLFTFYTQDVSPSVSSAEKLERYETAGVDYRQYYSTLKHLTPDLRAVSVFDSDGRDLEDVNISDDFRILYWSRYELENYFITPERLEAYAIQRLGEKVRGGARKIVDALLLELAFKGDKSMVASYHGVPQAVRVSLLQRVKMSKFAEDFFRRLAEETRTPILLNKGQFCQLIAGLKIEEVPAEVIRRLDCIHKMLFRGGKAQEPNIEAEKLNIGRPECSVLAKKPNIHRGEHGCVGEKANIRMLESKLLELTGPTKANIRTLHRLYHTTEFFKRSDVMASLGLKEVASSQLLERMLTLSLILPVSGHGKGAYTFAEEYK